MASIAETRDATFAFIRGRRARRDRTDVTESRPKAVGSLTTSRVLVPIFVGMDIARTLGWLRGYAMRARRQGRAAGYPPIC
jgi:hypothetical protein